LNNSIFDFYVLNYLISLDREQCNCFDYLNNNKHYCVEKCFDNHFKKGSECVINFDYFINEEIKECNNNCPNDWF